MDKKIVIYQVLPRLFGANSTTCIHNGSKAQNGCGHFSDFTKKALNEIKQLGANYIWYTGVLAHATKSDYSKYGIPNDDIQLVKGNAGSPYAVKDYYDVDADLADNVAERMNEFVKLINRSHETGLKVIIDFVPNHVAAEYKGMLNPFNDENYYPGHIHDGDWTDTAKLNYGNHDTWQKMVDILLFWLQKGVDGFRCDMAELVTCSFWNWAIPLVKSRHKDVIFIAEVYNPYEYRNYIYYGHFDYLYDKVGLYDTLKNVIHGQSASLITQCWQSVDDIKPHMVNFLENHDEQRLASEAFADDARKGRPALLVSALMGTNPFMLYFGQELGERAHDAEGFSGQDCRTSIFDYWTIDSVRRWRNNGKFGNELLTKDEKSLRDFYTKILNLCNDEPALQKGLFFDIMYANYDNMEMDTNKVYAFLRGVEGQLILVMANFSDENLKVKVKIPAHAYDYMNIPRKDNASGRDLLRNQTETYSLMPDVAIDIDVPAWNGRVIKFEY
ncbi:MAG: alpha-amylase family glycosyl hydrolase [Bacteroidaceae bacterium]|nr:alpha-amylase family glycosyl hydrolase [Bacteroidaceae bacterium]